MAKKSSIPVEISQYLPCKCTRIRNDRGTYRVYKYKAVKLPSGKWSNDAGYLIGKIIPGVGFSPNKRYQDELAKEAKLDLPNEITDVSYGKYALMISLTQNVLDDLLECFSAERAYQIYSYAMILCVNKFVHIDQIDEYFQESFLSVLYEHIRLRLGYKAIKNLLHELGNKRNPVKKFEQLQIDNSSNEFAIDGHVIRSCSLLNDLSEPGYKMKSLKASQVNQLVAFDLKKRIPVMYRTYRGSSLDKSSCLDLLKSRTFKNSKFYVDCGFYSAELLKMMSENGNSYTIPVPKSNTDVKRIKKTLEYSSGDFVYCPNEKESAYITYYEEVIDEETNTRIIFYKDHDENNSTRKSYKKKMALGETGYTQEKYDEYGEWWGVYILQTTMNGSAEEIFEGYKDRWLIETYYNYIKNDASFYNLKEQDYYAAHGFDFIMLITGILHSKLNEAVSKLKRSDISTIDVLLKAGHMRMVKNDKEWTLHNTRKKDIDLLEKLGFVPDVSFSA